MKNKLKFIIPIVIAVIAIIVAVLCIDFMPAEKIDVPSLVSTAQKYLLENNYEQAIAEFNKIIEIDPMNIDAYIGIAEAYVGMDDTEKAIEWLEKGYAATGDERLKNMIDELQGKNNADGVTVTTATKTEFETESVIEEAIATENKITYADGWYSIFKYENKNIVSMELYNKDKQLRLNATYEYIGNDVKRTVYLDGELYETTNVVFTDIMEEAEKAKKELANTRKEYYENGCVYVYLYDDNGNCIEYVWHSLDSDVNETYGQGGEAYFKNGESYKDHYYYYSETYNCDNTTYYDNMGYPLKLEGTVDGDTRNITYTYQYDDNGYPIVQYENGEKSDEYINFYNNNEFIYAIIHFKNEYNDSHNVLGGYELNKSGQYIRYLSHRYAINANCYSNVWYYIPSYDESKMIDQIHIDCLNIKPLFECPYCNN